MEKIGINEFALRQTKRDFVGTRLSMTQLTLIKENCNILYNTDKTKLDNSDYADFCKYVVIVQDSYDGIICPIIKITDENKHLLVTKYHTRVEGELPYLARNFSKNVLYSINDPHHLLVVLYSREQLEKEYKENEGGSPPVGSDYDIICVNAEPSEINSPMTPDTIIRNSLGTEFGGSGVELDKAKYMESVEYWSKHAMVDY